MTPSSRYRQAHALARETGSMLTARLKSGDPSDLDLLAEIAELDWHDDGSVGLVLDPWGPHVALVLGRGAPHVEVWWGGVRASVELDLDRDAVTSFLASLQLHAVATGGSAERS